jgi:hypothetical protein
MEQTGLYTASDVAGIQHQLLLVTALFLAAKALLVSAG